MNTNTELYKLFLKRIHDEASCHKNRLDGILGCFHCLQMFTKASIKEWIDYEQTALCPYCGIDSVISIECLDVESFKILLEIMEKYWFDLRDLNNGEESEDKKN